jgi:hypothetical protein
MICRRLAREDEDRPGKRLKFIDVQGGSETAESLAWLGKPLHDREEEPHVNERT